MVQAVAARPWLAFVLMGAFFLLFGLTSLNLFVIFRANIELFLEHGAMVLDDGAGVQFVQLLIYGYLSTLFWVLFKACEKILVDRVTGESKR